jgi:hypothetical protein
VEEKPVFGRALMPPTTRSFLLFSSCVTCVRVQSSAEWHNAIFDCTLQRCTTRSKNDMVLVQQ